MVSEFVKLISDHENVFEIPLNGVGSDINLVDRVVGGTSTRAPYPDSGRDLLTAFRYLRLGNAPQRHHRPSCVSLFLSSSLFPSG